MYLSRGEPHQTAHVASTQRHLQDYNMWQVAQRPLCYSPLPKSRPRRLIAPSPPHTRYPINIRASLISRPPNMRIKVGIPAEDSTTRHIKKRKNAPSTLLQHFCFPLLLLFSIFNRLFKKINKTDRPDDRDRRDGGETYTPHAATEVARSGQNGGKHDYNGEGPRLWNSAAVSLWLYCATVERTATC